MSAAKDYETTAQDAMSEAAKRISTPDPWETGTSQWIDLERGRLAQTRALTAAILSVGAELHIYNLSAALVTGVVRLGTPAGGAIRAEILEHLGITTTAKES